MDPVNLVFVCVVAFSAVFFLLAVLAVAMRLITIVFPAPTSKVDPAVVAAISTAVATVWPAARLTRLEEDR